MMEDKKIAFDPLAWANKSEENAAPKSNELQTVKNTGPTALCQPSSLEDELAKATATVEELVGMGANIADSYDDYVKLGFSLADGLGSEGRELYHRLCAQSAKYREADCEKKWQECLSKHDGRTTIASFYKMAQEAGVDLSAISRRFFSLFSFSHGPSDNSCSCMDNSNNITENVNNKDIIDNTGGTDAINSTFSQGSEKMRKVRKTESPADESEYEQKFAYNETFSDKLAHESVPSLLLEVMETQHDTESQDKVAIGALILWSGTMPNVEGVYDEKRVSPELYAILNAPTGIANKGAVDACRQLVMPIEWGIRHEQDRAQEEYGRQMNEWQALPPKQRKDMSEPKEPKYQSLFIAANSSASVVYEDLDNNDGRGIIFETEADTLANVQTQEWGQWSDLMRKAFHHERVTLSRKSENCRIVIDHPRLAVLLTCTPGQIPLLLPANQVENGLANRYLFYCARGKKGWRSPFKSSGETLEEKMYRIGQRFQKLYSVLRQRANSPLEFTFSQEQQKRFDAFFEPLYDEQIGMNGDELSAFIFRLGLSTFRIALVLTVLRCADREPMVNPESSVLVCSDHDFQTAITIANTLINHTCHVYANILPHVEKPAVAPNVKMPDRQRQLFIDMTDEFTTPQWYQRAVELNITKKTADRYLGDFCNKLHLATRVRNGLYRKTPN